MYFSDPKFIEEVAEEDATELGDVNDHFEMLSNHSCYSHNVLDNNAEMFDNDTSPVKNKAIKESKKEDKRRKSKRPSKLNLLGLPTDIDDNISV